MAVGVTLPAVLMPLLLSVSSNVAALRADVSTFRAVVRSDMANMSTGLRSDMASQHTEVRSDMADLRGDVADMRRDLYALGERVARMEGRLDALAPVLPQCARRPRLPTRRSRPPESVPMRSGCPAQRSGPLSRLEEVRRCWRNA